MEDDFNELLAPIKCVWWPLANRNCQKGKVFSLDWAYFLPFTISLLGCSIFAAGIGCELADSIACSLIVSTPQQAECTFIARAYALVKRHKPSQTCEKILRFGSSPSDPGRLPLSNSRPYPCSPESPSDGL